MNRIIKFILGVLISVIGLYYAFRQINFWELWISIKNVNFILVILAIVILLLSNVIRAWRWQILVKPIKDVSFEPAFSSIMIGYFGNSVLPFRMGEFLRAFVVADKTSLTASTAFGTIVIERILDFIGLSIVILLIMTVYPLTSVGGSIIIGVIVLSLTAFIFFFLFGGFKSSLLVKIEKLSLLRIGLLHKILLFIKNFLDGATTIRATNKLGIILLYTLIIWIMYYCSTYLATIAIGIELEWFGFGVLLISTTLAISIPAAPGYVGTYHAAAVYILTNLFDVGRSNAQAAAIILHAVG
ncbi:MAG: lysylphosphatidylglycerol synthase transmembrane domain-containing protein, partial [Candidatus Neomarinimicrobiota bacterium]|nr:lysylphosphatidylglycerol synthase transmembrane domain-containing protein [Candidatus Neomarinimicrobiota bacterium]